MRAQEIFNFNVYKHAVWALLSISVQAIPASSLHRRNLVVERLHVDER